MLGTTYLYERGAGDQYEYLPYMIIIGFLMNNTAQTYFYSNSAGATSEFMAV